MPSSARRAPHFPVPGPNLHPAFPTEWQASALHLCALNPIYLLSACVLAGPAPSSSYAPSPPPPPANHRPSPPPSAIPLTPSAVDRLEQALEVLGKVPEEGGSDLEGRGRRRVYQGRGRRRKISGSGPRQRVLDSQSPKSCPASLAVEVGPS